MVTQIEIPPRLRPDGDNGYLEELTKAIFRSGFSWRVGREKWDSPRWSMMPFLSLRKGADWPLLPPETPERTKYSIRPGFPFAWWLGPMARTV